MMKQSKWVWVWLSVLLLCAVLVATLSACRNRLQQQSNQEDETPSQEDQDPTGNQEDFLRSDIVTEEEWNAAFAKVIGENGQNVNVSMEFRKPDGAVRGAESQVIKVQLDYGVMRWEEDSWESYAAYNPQRKTWYVCEPIPAYPSIWLRTLRFDWLWDDPTGIHAELSYYIDYKHFLYNEKSGVYEGLTGNLDELYLLTVKIKDGCPVSLKRVDAYSESLESGYEIRFFDIGSTKLEHFEIANPDGFYYTPKQGGWQVINYFGEESALAIPAEFCGMPVVSVDGKAFRNRNAITELSLPASVRRIEESSFRGYPELRTVSISPGLETVVAARAFADCPKLETVEFTGAGFDLEVGVEAFAGCKALKSITLPPAARNLSQDAVRNCPELIIYSSAHSQPGQWSKRWNPDNRPVVWGYRNVTTDAAYDFVAIEGEAYLTRYKAQEEVVEIPAEIAGYPVVGFGRIFDQAKLRSITIPASVKTIGAYQFDLFEVLEAVRFGAGSRLQSIGVSAFYGCKNLKELAIPEHTERIGYSAFVRCESLTSIALPAGVTALPIRTFEFCTSLETVRFAAKHVELDTRVFFGCQNLGSITFPEGGGFSGIGSGAFQNCFALKTMAVHTTEIGAYAFSGSGLTSVEIGAEVSEIQEEAFADCADLTEVVFAANSRLSEVKRGTFRGTRLTAVRIPSGVQYISEAAFSDCKELMEVVFDGDASLTYIGRAAFQGTGLKTIAIPARAVEIGPYAFDDCRNLEEISFSKSNRIHTIEECAFRGTALTSVVLPGYLKDIGKNAFQNCKNLQQVVLPVTLKYIREGAFAGCKELVEIKFNDVPSRWVRVIKELGWIDDLSAVTVILRDEF